MELEEMLAKAVEAVLAKQQGTLPTVETVSKADVDTRFAEFKSEISTLLTETVAKAFGEMSREGTGRKSTLTAEEEMEKDPISFLTKKASATAFDELSAPERRAVADLTLRALRDGMKE